LETATARAEKRGEKGRFRPRVWKKGDQTKKMGAADARAGEKGSNEKGSLAWGAGEEGETKNFY